MDAFCLEAIDPLINIPHHDAVRCVQLVPHDHLDHSNAGDCDKAEKICLVSVDEKLIIGSTYTCVMDLVGTDHLMSIINNY